ncbi:unnamed protein product, partial [Closterium sp. Naga37s-1]
KVIKEFVTCSLTDAFSPSYCSVPGIYCDYRGMVNSLDLGGRSLAGCSIPYSISKLSALTKLSLANNKLMGTIPDSISTLTKLWKLELWKNQLSGSIPSGIMQLPRLAYLGLSQNQLSGSIPGMTTESAHNYLNLQLQGNQLSGTLPPSLGKIYTLSID